MQPSQGWGAPSSPLSIRIVIFILEVQTWLLRMQPSQGWGAPSSPLSTRIAVFMVGAQTLLRVQHSQGWSTPGSPLSAKIAVFMFEVQTWPLSILKNTILAAIYKVFCALMSFVIFRV